MSRRPPNPAADRAAQNGQTIKSLLKLEGNKSCADCKRNKHPRWASWNLGIFVCIRCSGIHRGMGTHISRVKSVDLDAWTDEQLQSVLKWGNNRANKYWEAKLAPGHVPSEAKIENFIRTKYESKRWVMDGPIPDPSTLDAEGDDDIPLNLVKEKHSIDRSASQKAVAAAPQTSGPSSIQRARQVDLFGDTGESTSRPSTTSPPIPRPTPKAEAAPPKQTKPADSLLGLDFFGTETAVPNRPSSVAATPGVTAQSRPDLKQSILSLYATAPRPQPQQQSSQTSFGAMQHSNTMDQPKTSGGGLTDAFSGLNFGGSTSPQSTSVKPSAFAGLGNLSSHRSTPSQGASSGSNFSTGSFFDPKPTPKPLQQPAPQHSRGLSSSIGINAFTSPSSATPVMNSQPASGFGMNDLFDFTTPAPTQPVQKQTVATPPAQNTSVFNLSAPQPSPPEAKPYTPKGNSNWTPPDAWGHDNAWSSSSTAPPKISSPTSHQAPPAQTMSSNFGWASGTSLTGQSITSSGGGGFTPASLAASKVSADEDFGGWSSAAPASPKVASPPGAKPTTGFATSEDLFSNVWQ